MDLGIEKQSSKVIIKWSKVKCDYYRIFFKKGDEFLECAKVKDDTQIRLSLVPFGESEYFVQAVKNGIVVDKSAKTKFVFDDIDTVVKDDYIYYSKFEGAKGYRLYKNKNNEGFNGCKNSDKEYIKAEKDKNVEYKIKPFEEDENGRVFLQSSSVFKTDTNIFKSASLYKSYNFNLFLSWNFKGDADGFLVYTRDCDLPVFESYSSLCHHAEFNDLKNSTVFIIKAFVNTPDGRFIIAQSEPVMYSIRKYKKPDVSLIIPAYNAQNYIARSISSALASDFANLEIIIVNDGSTDETQKIIDWYAKSYENIVAVQKENGGVADTRNEGIKIAKGEFIAFMDNDDLIRPDMISSLYESICKNDCDVAIAPLYRITDKGYTTHCNLPFENDTAYDIDDYLKIMYTPGYYNCAIWNKLYRSTIVKEHPLGKGLRYEDVSWTPCILSYAKKFCFLNTPFYEWDRKTRPETFGDFLAKKPEHELFEHRKRAMAFFIENGNPEKREFLKTIAKRRLARYGKNTTFDGYAKLSEKIEKGERIL